jgi:phosphoribulokinase
MIPRPVILGVVGDSAAGKTTITRGLVRVLGEENVTHVGTDDYHRYDRKQRAERRITPLDPDCNYIDIIAQHLGHLYRGEPILKPVYRHTDGTFGPPVYVKPARFVVIEGLLGYHLPEMREVYDVRVFLNPPEEVRRRWKVQRDTTRRGYTTSEVLAELDRREQDSEAFIRPQRRWADIEISFMPIGPDAGSASDFGAELTLREGLTHPDFAQFVEDASPNGLTMDVWHGAPVVRIPGRMDSVNAAEIEEAVWDRMHFASHLRSNRLGEFTVGTELRRSDSLAIVQLLILYHLVTARAAVALGAPGRRTGEHHTAEPAAAEPARAVR